MRATCFIWILRSALAIALAITTATAGAQIISGPPSPGLNLSGVMLPAAVDNLYMGKVFLYPSGGDDTSAMSSAISAAVSAGACLKLSVTATDNGTFKVSSLTVPSGACIIGSGIGKTIIQRAANAAAGTMMTFNGNTYEVRDLTIDGNKSNETSGGNDIVLSGAFYGVHFRNIRVTGAKANAGWGGGIVGSGVGVDGSQNTISYFQNILVDNNDASGCLMSGDDAFLIADSKFTNNGQNGCAVKPSDGSIPGGVTAARWIVSGNHFINNGQHGFSVGSFVTANGPLGQVPGPNPVGQGFTITGNEAANNGFSGISYQGEDATISGNDVHNNGSGSDSGILLNATRTLVTGNAIYDNNYYGVDAGGCVYCQIKANNIYANVGVGVNGGGTTNTVISGNVLNNNPRNITVYRYESGGNGPLLTPTSGLQVDGNEIYFSGSTDAGIHSYNASQISAHGNRCYLGASLGSAVNCYIFETNSSEVSIANSDNEILNSSGQELTIVPSAAFVTIPDGGSLFSVTGTTAITNLESYTMAQFSGALVGVLVTPGSGANGSETMSFSGGGCSVAPTATPMIANNATLVGATITNKGSGCTSTPTCVINGGTLSGATCTAIIGGGNIPQRRVTLVFPSGGSIDTGGFQLLNGNFTAGTNGGNIVLLGSGASNKWTEVTRAAF